MRIRHSDRVWAEFPGLVAGVLYAEGIGPVGPESVVQDRITRYSAVAADRLATATESELPEIRAWRRAFAAMGVKPTRYRCASEALLRRFRREGSLPRIHPLIDLCNAISLAFAIPVAALDTARVTGSIEVRHATGTESYLTFGGTVEHPEPGEVVFADDAGEAHARRWTNRQSGRSAVREGTSSVLIVAEALHDNASDDVPRLVDTLADDLASVWAVSAKTAILRRSAPEFAFGG